MINLNQTLPRRTFLRGVGATLALPLLDAMKPAAAALAPSQSPIRLGYVYTPNGIVGACDKSPRPFMWTPKTTGEVRSGYDVTVRMLPCPSRPRRGLPGGSVTRRKWLPAMFGMP